MRRWLYARCLVVLPYPFLVVFACEFVDGVNSKAVLRASAGVCFFGLGGIGLMLHNIARSALRSTGVQLPWFTPIYLSAENSLLFQHREHAPKAWVLYKTANAMVGCGFLSACYLAAFAL